MSQMKSVYLYDPAQDHEVLNLVSSRFKAGIPPVVGGSSPLQGTCTMHVPGSMSFHLLCMLVFVMWEENHTAGKKPHRCKEGL